MAKRPDPVPVLVSRPTRRRFLGGATVAVGLPILESMAGRRGFIRRAEAATAPKRLLVYYIPNGVYLKDWTPPDAGVNYTLSPTLQPIAPVRNDILVLSGLTNRVGVPPTVGGAHAAGLGALLTCTQWKKPAAPMLGRSVDQLIADTIGVGSNLPSLELVVRGDRAAADGPSILATNLSWRGPSTPAPPISDPQAAFNRLFAGLDRTASAAEAAKRTLYRKSVLDVVQADARQLSGRLSTSDRSKLDEYMTGLRDVEGRIQTTGASAATCNPVSPGVDNGDMAMSLSLHHDLIALAFQCDATRVISLMLGYALGVRSYAFMGVPGDGHGVTHHAGNPVKIAAEKKIDTWRVQQFVSLVQRLKGIEDVDGRSVLSNSLIYYTSEIANGNNHNQDNKPILLAGQLGGAVKTGRHLEFPENANGVFQRCDEFSKVGCGQPALGNLYVTLLRMYGANATSFGETGNGTFNNLGG